MDKNIQLSLSVEEINLILEALGQMPYIRVSQIIPKIQQQASLQLDQYRLAKSENDQNAASSPNT